MKKIFFLSTLICLGFLSQAQPDVKNVVSDANAEVRTVGSFRGIAVSSAVTLYLSQGNEEAVAVSCEDADENKRIKTEVKNGILKIYLESGSWNAWNWKNKRVRAYVTAKTLEYISGSGASAIKVNEEIKSSNLKIDVSGASSFKGQVKSSTLKLEATGASVISIEGSTDDVKIEASGASSVKAYDLQSNKCNVEASGASAVGISVKDALIAEASGASSVRYKGSPSAKECNSSGASSIKQKTD